MRLPVFLLICAAALTPLSAAPIRVNGIAAKANGDLITMNELMIKLGPIQSVLMARYPQRGARYEAVLKMQRDQILDELINRTIIYTEFKDRIRAIPERAVEEDVERHIQRVYAGDKKLFRDYLKATNLTFAQFKEQQRKELLVQIMRSQQFPDLPPPTEPELKEAYNEWKIVNRDRSKDVATYRKIVLRHGIDRDATFQKAQTIVNELEAGADFAAKAKEFSIDSKADEGGLWKDMPRTDLSLEFGAIIFDNEEDGIIGPIGNSFGLTILKVEERKLGPSEPYTKAPMILHLKT